MDPLNRVADHLSLAPLGAFPLATLSDGLVAAGAVLACPTGNTTIPTSSDSSDSSETTLESINFQRARLLAEGAREPMTIRLGARAFKALCMDLRIEESESVLSERLGMKVEIQKPRAASVATAVRPSP